MNEHGLGVGNQRGGWLLGGYGSIKKTECVRRNKPGEEGKEFSPDPLELVRTH